jgi:vacuolar-type H+-ATPase subunit E/Vma4
LSLLELRTEIERRTQEEVSKTIEEGKREAERISVEGLAKAQALRNERTKALARELDEQERAELATTRMDLKGKLLEFKSEWCRRVFEEAEKRVAQQAKASGQDYRELLSKLALEGISKLRGSQFVVEVESKDVEAVRKALKAIQEKAGKIKSKDVVLRVEAVSGATVGGVIVTTEDKTQSYNNLLEARISMATRNLVGETYRILFEGVKE